MLNAFLNYSPRISPLLLAGTTASILLASLILEHIFQIPLCRMCILERYPYMVATGLGIVLYFSAPTSPLYRVALSLLLLTFVVSAGLSFYHIGIEHVWFDLPSFCQPHSPPAATFDALRAQILGQTTVVPCNVVSLRIFFLSLAEWNGIISLLLTGATWILLKKK